MNKALVIGIGNRFRGDDAAGLEVAISLEQTLSPLVDIVYFHGDPIDLMDLWKGRDFVFLIDAVSTGNKKVGHLHRLRIHEKEIATDFFRSSTHLFGIAEVIELARSLGKLPPQVILYGIEGKDYHLESTLSQNLKEELKEIMKKIELDIRKSIPI